MRPEGDGSAGVPRSEDGEVRRAFRLREPMFRVDKEGWIPCGGCGERIPALSRYGRGPDGSNQVLGHQYVCPRCGHCCVGPEQATESDGQTKCHNCGAALEARAACPGCGYPRGWTQVQCPYCGEMVPVDAPHLVYGCTMSNVECVHCEGRFPDLCVC